MREIQVRVELCCYPDFAGFDSPMVGWVVKDKIRLLAVFEKQVNVFKKAGLIVFDCEVVMGLPLFNQVEGKFTLG